MWPHFWASECRSRISAKQEQVSLFVCKNKYTILLCKIMISYRSLSKRPEILIYNSCSGCSFRDNTKFSSTAGTAVLVHIINLVQLSVCVPILVVVLILV